jgi:hypothetical protein
MLNMLLFVAVLSVIFAAECIGIGRLKTAPAALPVAASDAASPQRRDSLTQPPPAQPQPQTKTRAATVPNIGSVQVLNGCGAEGAANRVADYLRSRSFDVKDIGNASSWNHQATMIISRTADMSLANSIEKLMKTGKVVLIRNADSMYDVTVVAGPDFEERLK